MEHGQKTIKHPRDLPPLCELHTHLGSAVDPVVLWTIAHEQGIKLPAKDYWGFNDMITMAEGRKNLTLRDMHNHFFHWTELIQSSPEALEIAAHSVIGGGYRKCNLVQQELRFCPMKRNRGGERDLDHIILSTLWGVRRAMLEYPQVRAGVIVMMDRTFTYEQNKVVVEKAIRYSKDGVIGVDLAGPSRDGFSMQEIAPLFARAREAGLGVTVHTGEDHGSSDEMEYVIKEIKPDRIGHGVRAAENPKLLKLLQKSGIVLELCPTSNLKNSIVRDVQHLREIIRAFVDAGVPITINTDGPEMYQINIAMEEAFLMSENILSEKEIETARAQAFKASFLNNPPYRAALVS